jgi:activator of 2-hydroxyglutaryl-CoA dehydratase
MVYTSGIDIGSTYTKALILDADKKIAGYAMNKTGFKLEEVAQETHQLALKEANLEEKDISYIIATGFGRHQATFSDLAVTDLTASSKLPFPKHTHCSRRWRANDESQPIGWKLESKIISPQ